MARRPQNVDQRSSRKVWRFGSWAAVAVMALGSAGFAAFTSRDSHGSTRELAEASALGREAEARRLAETVRLLAADRDRLAARLAVLERNMGDMTGSIAPGANRPIPGASPGAPPVLGPSPPPPVATVPPATAPGKPLQAIGDPSTAPDPGAIGSVATKTEFGVDLGGGPSIDALRALWTQVKAGNEQLFDGLRPVMSIREAARPGTVELRLLAGPLGNATAAARICAVLAAAGLTCQPAIFDGQRLALK
jgi:hypothetical protein